MISHRCLLRHMVLVAALVAFIMPQLWTSPADAQEDVVDPDYSYNMFYPKYARGLQPTAYDVGEFDSVNLYNGGLSLAIPLGPPLIAGADLSWQLALHYSSKFWSWDRRRNGKECQGKSFIVGDAHAGLGWTFRLLTSIYASTGTSHRQLEALPRQRRHTRWRTPSAPPVPGRLGLPKR